MSSEVAKIAAQTESPAQRRMRVAREAKKNQPDAVAALQSKVNTLEAALAEAKQLATPPRVGVTGWYLCPLCKGLGEIPSDEPRRILRGIKTFGHIRCTQCGGMRMVKESSDVALAKGYKPIVLCPKCQNFYAQGGGHAATETNDPFTPTSIGKSQAHSHWHDFSIHAPPDYVPGESKAAHIQSAVPA